MDIEYISAENLFPYERLEDIERRIYQNLAIPKSAFNYDVKNYTIANLMYKGVDVTG